MSFFKAPSAPLSRPSDSGSDGETTTIASNMGATLSGLEDQLKQANGCFALIKKG